MGHILVIDDDAQVRALMRQVLLGAGHSVAEAADGAAGTKLFRQRGADLVITNIFMPEKEGLETILELRRAAPRLPIIAVSGGAPRVHLDVLGQARQLGASRCLAKPFDVNALVAAVGELL
jgi:CheY-like chemotaxis protein